MREPDDSTPAERARAGVRAWVREAAGRTGGRARAAGPYAILASLTAAAVAPGLPATLSRDAVLTEASAATAERLRDGGEQAGEQRWRDAFAADLLPRLAAGDDRGRALHEEISRVLRETDAIGTAISEAALTDDELRRVLEAAFQELGLGVGELRWMLGDLRRSVDDLHRQLAARSVWLHRELSEARRHLIAVTRERLPEEAGVPAGAPAGVVAPYPGLVSFQPEDAPWFRGREQQVAELLGQLAEQVEGGPPLVITGVSGVGKSSLVRAGLLPGIAAGALGEQAAAWPWVLTTPGVRPLADLRARLRALAATGDGTLGEPAALTDTDPRSLGELAALAAGAGRRPVIVVDQFEELFTRCADPAERLAYATALTSAAPALVVIAVRAEGYPDCLGLPPLAQALAGGHVVLGPLDAAAIHRAVVEPAERAGLGVEAGLPGLLLEELRGGRPDGYDPGELPLLAHALRATWDRREGVRLTVAAYRATGGIRHAIAETAEKIFGDLPPEDGERLRLALLALVSVAADGTVALRRGDRAAADARVLRRLVKARLVTVGAETVEISHEALLTGWPRLAGWVAEVREDLLLREQITGAARDWDGAGRDPRLLPHGSWLLAARERVSGAGEMVEDYLAAAELQETARRRGLRWWQR